MNIDKQFVDITNKLEDSFIYITKKNSFLSGNLEKFQQYLLGDCNELLNNDDIKGLSYTNMTSFLKYGIKPIEMEVFEIIRFYEIHFCEISANCGPDVETISGILSQNDDKLLIMNVLSESIIKKWFEFVLHIIIDSFHNYESKTKLNYIIVFVCLIIIIILYYSIIWKMEEQKLIVLLKGSVDLINLIPQEIKNIIIEKLNE